MSTETAIFGGGCFWCLEAIFVMLKGVKKVESGYAGGFTEDPDYRSVCSGNTGHAEIIRIEFDPDIISYGQLLEIFFTIHDPTTLNRQGNDTGPQYRSIILYTSPGQEKLAKDYIQKLKKDRVYSDSIVTEIEPLDKFYKAEDYHQDYFINNSSRTYCSLVISPKVEKFRKKFGSLLK
ncbi:MAG: peptide-methionine (S)-S-oxide reductase MsrA [Actinobacteria bacterium]|nr:peptide-methionine (S)-S-oxide reductase MsrA [Actinomycetota bacterium]